MAAPARRSLALAFLLACAPLALAGGVRIAEDPAAGPFPTIQAAVDAALDGQTLLVGGGTYPGFAIDGKGLALFAAPNAPVRVEGTIEVRNLAPQRNVLLRGFQIEGRTQMGAAEPALVLDANAGQVRVQSCTLRGGAGLEPANPNDCSSQPFGDGGHGAVLSGSPRVVFADSILAGGEGGGTNQNTYECVGGDGGDGLRSTGSVPVIYDCVLTGGHGGSSGLGGGHGGSAGRVLDFALFAAGSSFTGGDGGHGWDFIFAFGGDGGHGLLVEGPAQAQLLDDAFAGGAAGIAIVFPANNGAAGQPIAGPGAVAQHPGQARKFRTAASIAADGSLIAVHVTGVAGDLVFLPGSFRPGWRPLVPTTGVWLLPFPVWMSGPLEILPASGQATLQVGIAAISAPAAARVHHLQGYVLGASGGAVLGSPMHVLALDRDGGPDCNGNGVSDFFDVLEGTSPDCGNNLVPDACDPDCNANGVPDDCDIQAGTAEDCDANGVPDSCDVNSGAVPDCNGNGIPDACDLASGTSLDRNGNGVPDECEPPVILHVDAAAPPGGDGSAGSPFDEIGEAILASKSGDTVLVRDGLYVGPGNRGMSLGGRGVVVRSMNGPAACTIDCQDQGRAFLLAGEPASARVQGFTIRRGFATGPQQRGGAILMGSSAATIEDCVIQDCFAAITGGGIHADGSARIERCRFEGNRTVVDGSGFGHSGGALLVSGHAQVVLSDFVSNEADQGGAVFVGGRGTLAHCRFLGNLVPRDGGALYHQTNGTGDLVVDDCLFAGNQAGLDGGAVYGTRFTFSQPSTLRISASTFAINRASGSGGALAVHSGQVTELHGSILWSNAAPSGAQIAGLAAGSSTPQMLVRYCDVQGGLGGVPFAGGNLVWGPGNIDVDPLFADPDGPDGMLATLADNDYRLAAGSPCADAGDNGAVAPDVFDLDGDGNVFEPVPFDLDFLPRFVDDPAVPDTGLGSPPIVDMGVFERQ